MNATGTGTGTGTGSSHVARRVGVLIAALAVITGGLAACGLPTDERVTPYNVDDIPDQLTEQTTTTTSTTTTTTTPTTVVPQPTAPGETAPPPPSSTTTTLPAQTEPITVYYTIGSSDDLSPLQVNRRENPSTQEVVAALESTTGLSALGLRTSVRPGLIMNVIPERGVATIVLDPVVLDRMSEAQQRRAIAQMVLTFTRFQTPDQGNIAFVRFESEGDPYVVFVPALDDMSGPDDLLAFEDFADMIVNSTTTTVSTSTTSTTVSSTGNQ